MQKLYLSLANGCILQHASTGSSLALENSTVKCSNLQRGGALISTNLATKFQPAMHTFQILTLIKLKKLASSETKSPMELFTNTAINLLQKYSNALEDEVLQHKTLILTICPRAGFTKFSAMAPSILTANFIPSFLFFDMFSGGFCQQQITDIGCRPPVFSCHLSCPILNQLLFLVSGQSFAFNRIFDSNFSQIQESLR